LPLPVAEEAASVTPPEPTREYIQPASKEAATLRVEVQPSIDIVETPVPSVPLEAVAQEATARTEETARLTLEAVETPAIEIPPAIIVEKNLVPAEVIAEVSQAKLVESVSEPMTEMPQAAEREDPAELLMPPQVELQKIIEAAAENIIDHQEISQLSVEAENFIPVKIDVLDLSDLPEALEIHEQSITELVPETDLPAEVETLVFNDVPDNLTGDAAVEEIFDWESLLYPSEEAVPEPVASVEQFKNQPLNIEPEQTFTISEEDAADVPVLEAAKAENYQQVSADVIEVFERLDEITATIEPEVLEAVSEPVEKALQTIRDIHTGTKVSTEVLQQVEENLIVTLKELFVEIRFEIADNEVRTFARYLILQDAKGSIEGKTDAGFSKLFSYDGTREGRRYGMNTPKRQQTSRHNLIGRIMLLVYASNLVDYGHQPLAA
jgi:hypothetical protein